MSQGRVIQVYSPRRLSGTPPVFKHSAVAFTQGQSEAIARTLGRGDDPTCGRAHVDISDGWEGLSAWVVVQQLPDCHEDR